MRVVVYRNLNASKQGRVVWSVAQATGTDGKGRLIEHATEVVLTNVRAVVSKRAFRVRDEGLHREVCAWLAGDLSAKTIEAPQGQRVSFDLRGTCEFMADGQPFSTADRAVFTDTCTVEGAR